MIASNELPDDFPHHQWTLFVLDDCYARYDSNLRPSSSHLKEPHADTYIEQLLSGIEDSTHYVLSSEPVKFINWSVDKLFELGSLGFTVLTLSVAIPLCLFVLPILSFLFCPTLKSLICITPAFFYPISDILGVYYDLAMLLREVIWEAGLDSLDNFVRSRRHEPYGLTSD